VGEATGGKGSVLEPMTTPDGPTETVVPETASAGWPLISVLPATTMALLVGMKLTTSVPNVAMGVAAVTSFG